MVSVASVTVSLCGFVAFATGFRAGTEAAGTPVAKTRSEPGVFFASLFVSLEPVDCGEPRTGNCGGFRCSIRYLPRKKAPAARAPTRNGRLRRGGSTVANVGPGRTRLDPGAAGATGFKVTATGAAVADRTGGAGVGGDETAKLKACVARKSPAAKADCAASNSLARSDAEAYRLCGSFLRHFATKFCKTGGLPPSGG